MRTCSHTVGMPSQPRNRESRQRTNVLRIRLTDEERRLLDEYARERSLDTSTWARSELLSIVKRKASEGH